ncbi:MAG TPA: tol-pal system protein YbgF [Rhizomicrobium sp.]
MTQTRKSPASHLLWKMAPIGVVAVCGVVIGAVGAFADVSTATVASKPALVRRLEADEVQARVLQAHLFALQHGDQSAAPVRTAALFGESDEEKAARLAHEQSQDGSIAQLNQRVSDLEDSLRRLTGQMEQLDHKLNDINSHIDRMQKDFDYKICSMTAQQLGTTVDQLPCGGAAQSSLAPQQNSAPPPASSANETQHLAPPPGVLGTIPSNTPMPIPPPANPDEAPPAPAANINRPQFDAAMNLLSKAQYDEARAAFRSYADANPKSDLAPQAVYWVGDIAYLQKDYPNAARAFAEEIKKYGASPRAPDSMLKLGQSLIALKQKQEGCTALGALQSKYPQASQTVLGQAKAARKAAGCK